ncbi:hypothetical protein RFI_20827, partial [Reticulomyxa filosa]
LHSQQQQQQQQSLSHSHHSRHMPNTYSNLKDKSFPSTNFSHSVPPSTVYSNAHTNTNINANNNNNINTNNNTNNSNSNNNNGNNNVNPNLNANVNININPTTNSGLNVSQHPTAIYANYPAYDHYDGSVPQQHQYHSAFGYGGQINYSKVSLSNTLKNQKKKKKKIINKAKKLSKIFVHCFLFCF